MATRRANRCSFVAYCSIKVGGYLARIVSVWIHLSHMHLFLSSKTERGCVRLYLNIKSQEHFKKSASTVLLIHTYAHIYFEVHLKPTSDTCVCIMSLFLYYYAGNFCNVAQSS